jgi:hypothetical protein
MDGSVANGYCLQRRVSFYWWHGTVPHSRRMSRLGNLLGVRFVRRSDNRTHVHADAARWHLGESRVHCDRADDVWWNDKWPVDFRRRYGCHRMSRVWITRANQPIADITADEAQRLVTGPASLLTDNQLHAQPDKQRTRHTRQPCPHPGAADAASHASRRSDLLKDYSRERFSGVRGRGRLPGPSRLCRGVRRCRWRDQRISARPVPTPASDGSPKGPNQNPSSTSR